MTDEDFENLGLHAFGDRVALQQACKMDNVPSSSTSAASSSIRKRAPLSLGRRRRLLELVRTGHTSESVKQQNDQKEELCRPHGPGRPRSETRSINFGLRILESNSGNIRTVLNVPAPLGDSNTIKLAVNIETGYDELLELLADKFFPNGKNPAVGEKERFIGMEVVNVRNENIKDSTHNTWHPFSVGDYIVSKMISGSVRLNLLCIPGGFEKKVSESSDDELPDITAITRRTTDQMKELKHEDVVSILSDTDENYEGQATTR